MRGIANAILMTARMSHIMRALERLMLVDWPVDADEFTGRRFELKDATCQRRRCGSLSFSASEQS
jgi:hypothetical protein